MSSVKLLTTLVFDSFSGNSLVYLIVLFRQKCRLISVIVVVGLANLSCCCDHCVNVANKPDKNNVRQRTPPSGAPSLSLRRAGGREPWEGGCRERTRGGGEGDECSIVLHWSFCNKFEDAQEQAPTQSSKL